MKTPSHSILSRRERQIMDILYRRGRATASEVLQDLPSDLSDSTVRTHLRILEQKGYVRHEEDGPRFVFSPTVARTSARRSALKHLIDTFYDGSTGKMVTALVGAEAMKLTPEELRRIAELVERAQKEGEGGK